MLPERIAEMTGFYTGKKSRVHKYTGTHVNMSTCVLVYVFTFSLPPKVRWILAPQLRIPLQDFVVVQLVFGEPILRTANHDK